MGEVPTGATGARPTGQDLTLMTTPLWLRRARPVLTYLAVGLIGALAALVLMGLVSGTRAEVGPGTVEVRASLARTGGTGVSLPPLGNMTARTHRSPLHLRVRVDELDVEALQAALARPNPEAALEADIVEDLSPLLRRFARRLALASAIIGGLTGLVVARRHWTRVAAGAAGGLLAAGLILGWAWRGYDVDAFQEARYSGALERAPAMLEAARRHLGNIEDVRGHVNVLAGQVAAMYETIEDRRGNGETLILHVSDIHSNPLGMEMALRMARKFDVHAVLDTGDITSFGLTIEARIADLLGGFDRPYILVPGNHDSGPVRQALDEMPEVTLLDGDVARVEEVRILGVGDPTYTADNVVTTAEANQMKLDRAPQVARLVARTRPDVLAVHDRRQASASWGRVPLVVAGHTHQRRLVDHDGSLLAEVGSTGATGLGTFLVETAQPYEAQILRFEGRRLVAIDYITVRGIGGAFTLERTLIDAPEPPPLERLRTQGPR